MEMIICLHLRVEYFGVVFWLNLHVKIALSLSLSFFAKQNITTSVCVVVVGWEEAEILRLSLHHGQALAF